MSRWGVRWIFCWLSVIITAACGQFSSPTPTRENTDRVPTLQNFIPPSTASPTTSIRPIYTLTPLYTPAVARLATVEAGREAMLNQPTCFPTPAQSVICLGWVQNTQDYPISDILINFYLLNAQGHPQTAAQIHPVLATLSVQNGSPYRAIFLKASPDWIAYAEIADFEILTSAGGIEKDQPSIDFEATWQGDAYRVTGTVRTANEETEATRLVIVVRNDENRVTGFRVVEIALTEGNGVFDVMVATLDGQAGHVTIETEIISTP